MRGKYVVVLMDKNADPICDYVAETLKEAKQNAKYFLTDAYAKNCETTHDQWETNKVEVRNFETEEVLWDAFR